MCFKDGNGSFLNAQTYWSSPKVSVDEGEALGLLQAIKWAIDLQFSNVIFELDYLIVTNSIRFPKEDMSEVGAIVQECRDLLGSKSNFVVKFVMRQANVVAHSLARVATSSPSLHIFDSCPTCIADTIANEMI